MHKIKYATLLVLTLLFTGCATWAVLEGGPTKFKEPGFEASVPGGWMAFKPAYGFMMTRDGYSLNHVSVKKIKFLQRLAHTKKRFQVGMLLHEILEVEMDSIESNKGVYFLKFTKNEPTVIDSLEAYRLEYEYEQKNGLKIKAIQCGFIHNDFVYRIAFKAARIHYYEATIKDFENFLASFRLLN